MTSLRCVLLLMALLVWSVPSNAADPIKLEKVLVTLIEQVEVPARQRGQLTSIAVEEGDLVDEGTLLAQIDDTDAQLERNRAAIDLETARTRAKNTVKVRLAKKSQQLAESELRRGLNSRKLFADSVTDEELERRQLAVEKAALDVEQAEHEYELAQHQCRFSENELQIAQRKVELHKILAPIRGIVVQVNRRKGEWVEPGMTVVRILRIDRLRAEGFLDAGQVQGELKGRPVTLAANLPGRQPLQVHGTLKFVSPEINPVDGKIRVWAEIENTDLLLRPGLRASMTIDPGP